MRLDQACLSSGLHALERRWWHVVLSVKVPHARGTVSASKHSTSWGRREVEQMPAERHMHKEGDSGLRLVGTRRERWDLEREDQEWEPGRGRDWIRSRGWWLRRVSSLPAPAEWMWSPVASQGRCAAAQQFGGKRWTERAERCNLELASHRKSLLFYSKNNQRRIIAYAS